MSELAARTPQQVFEHHFQALQEGDMKEILADYAPSAFIVTPWKTYRGREGISQFFTELGETFKGDFSFDVKPYYEGDIVLLDWTAESSTQRVTDGVDTFLIRGGFIQAQTVHFTLTPKRPQA